MWTSAAHEIEHGTASAHLPPSGLMRRAKTIVETARVLTYITLCVKPVTIVIFHLTNLKFTGIFIMKLSPPASYQQGF